MRYGIGFDERSGDWIITDPSRPEFAKYNLAPFLQSIGSQERAPQFRAGLATLSSTLRSDDAIVTAFDPLNADIRNSLRRGHPFSWQDYERLNSLVTQFIVYFRNIDVGKISYVPPLECLNEPTHDDGGWAPGLYGRYGIVELRVIESYLRDQSVVKEALTDIRHHLGDETYMYSEGTREHWLSVRDVNFNLRKLMTNAGFYFANELVSPDIDQLDAWLREYMSALENASALFPVPACYPSYFVTQDYLFRKQGHLKNYVNFPAPARFYRSLKGEKVLFVTPFNREINHLYASGKIFRLYSDINIPDYDLMAVPAFISTYPNRPHHSWAETFEKMRDEVDKAFERENFTIFFASCGCYGMPICDYVYRRYGVVSVYYGNHTNTLFGIRQAGSEAFLSERRILENWAMGHLGDVRNMSKIDDGRYI